MSAASNLLGLTLDNGWVVTEKIARSPDASGGTFSESYKVRAGNRTAFLKAFDFSRAFEPGVDTAKEIEKLVNAYNHEREVLAHCGERRLSNVVVAIDHGTVQVPGLSQMEGRVFYMIFEKADGDVRIQMDMSKRCDALWCMLALKDTALGLHQVHKEMIAHQDTKPSNVLVYGPRTFKIADFGRSSRKGMTANHDNFNVAGDRTYAPPELLYGHLHADFIPRRMGCDLYMLGNLAAFLFSGANVTVQLFGHLDSQHHPANWTGTYEEVLPYVQHAFSKVLGDLKPTVDEIVRDEVVAFVECLCEPDLSRRGHPRGVGHQTQYSLQRYVSHLDLVATRVTRRLNTNRIVVA